MHNLRNFTLTDFEEFARSIGEKPQRARRLFAMTYRPDFSNLTQLSEISRNFSSRVQQEFTLGTPELKARETADDGTTKYLFRLHDGLPVESVLIPGIKRHTLCISTQAGCAMGCRFCLTATMGMRRNLDVSEITGQILHVRNELHTRGNIINNIVFMGMGEPLCNTDNCLKALEIMQSPAALNYSPRKITLSTCGIIPELRRFAGLSDIRIAISLHSADDAVRTQLMPVNRRYPVAELLDCCREISAERPIFFEYVMLDGINDSPADARALAAALHGINCKINLLPYNPAPALPFRRPEDAVMLRFKDILYRSGYRVMLRSSRGSDISAACGQLAAG